MSKNSLQDRQRKLDSLVEREIPVYPPRVPQHRSFNELEILGGISRPLREMISIHNCRNILSSLHVLEHGEPGLAAYHFESLEDGGDDDDDEISPGCYISYANAPSAWKLRVDAPASYVRVSEFPTCWDWRGKVVSGTGDTRARWTRRDASM